MNQYGHNETAVRLAALAGDAQVALDRVARGEADAIEGWLAYGAALNEGRALFAKDADFGKWVSEFMTDNLSVTPNDHDRAAAMWAAANADQLAEARAACNARTLRGWHTQWKKIEADREKARQKAEREAKAARQREEAEKARQEAETAAKAEEEARAAAAAAESETERKEAESRVKEAAAAKVEAEKIVAKVEAEPVEQAEDPEIAKARKALAALTRTGLEDEVIGLRADLAEAKRKNAEQRVEIARLKELNAAFSGDKDEVIRRLNKTIEHKNSEMYRANEKADAAMRQVHVLKKRVAELEQMGIAL